ncbi:hypothetical protein WS86_22275 [Burkholderia savannae]|uniref:immunity protein Imm33 domain-containing protein n=1 Tax=Burkholderia savannae TaxID=1637837 RepID=UPI000753F646|nr:hypothetical protein [Burkholderia savannae]AOJ83401.1 hypothetical protein WS86_22275 [Burkholderia savannae]
MDFRSLFRAPGSQQAARRSNAAVHRTVGCKQFGHPEFRIQVDDRAIPAQDANWLLRHFEHRVAEGERFRAGETRQIGWMLTMIEAGACGFLRVMEPDMKAIPIKFVDSVDNTLKHLRSQKDVAESIAADRQPDFPSLRQSAEAHVEYKRAGRVLMTRAAACDTDSGWSLTDLADEAGSQDPARFVRISLYQLGIDRADLIRFLALPPGLQVVAGDPTIHVMGPEGEIRPAPGSYLDALNKLRARRHVE